MSYIMPLFFSLFVIIIHTVFYYHDKAIIGGAAAESAAETSTPRRSTQIGGGESRLGQAAGAIFRHAPWPWRGAARVV